MYQQRLKVTNEYKKKTNFITIHVCIYVYVNMHVCKCLRVCHTGENIYDCAKFKKKKLLFDS